MTGTKFDWTELLEWKISREKVRLMRLRDRDNKYQFRKKWDNYLFFATTIVSCFPWRKTLKKWWYTVMYDQSDILQIAASAHQLCLQPTDASLQAWTGGKVVSARRWITGSITWHRDISGGNKKKKRLSEMERSSRINPQPVVRCSCTASLPLRWNEERATCC